MSVVVVQLDTCMREKKKWCMSGKKERDDREKNLDLAEAARFENPYQYHARFFLPCTISTISTASFQVRYPDQIRDEDTQLDSQLEIKEHTYTTIEQCQYDGRSFEAAAAAAAAAGIHSPEKRIRYFRGSGQQAMIDS